MAVQTIKIEGLDAYEARFGNIQPGEYVDTDIFFSGRDQMASRTTLGVVALKAHGQPRYFGSAAWRKRIVIAVQYPNLTYTATLIDAIVKAVKARPNVGALNCTGLSQGAIFWGYYLFGDDGTRAKQFAGCFLMSGSFSNNYLTKAAYVKHMKMVLLHGTTDGVVSNSTYRKANAVFKAAGVHITYVEYNAGHTDTVWSHQNPAAIPDFYKELTTPASSQPITDTDMTQVIVITGDATLDGSANRVYFAGNADSNITIPAAPATPFNIMLRNTGNLALKFKVPLHFNDTSTTQLNHGTFNIFWDDVKKQYWVMKYE